MSRQMLGSPSNLKLDKELSTITLALVTELSSHTPTKLINYQITLLELFKHEIKKLDLMNYCDYEMAYVSYTSALQLFLKVEKLDSMVEFQKIIKDTLLKNEDSFNSIRAFLQPPATDPLLQRFNSLKLATANSTADTLITSEYISANQLKSLSSREILLIDIRELKDYNHIHIKHKNIINIPSSTFQSVTDYQQLESKLRLQLSQEQFTAFKQINKFDYIVMYNYKFGFSLTNIGHLLPEPESDIYPKKNPFQKLIQLLFFDNQSLKQYPLYLSGGILAWHDLVGASGVTKTESEILPPKPAIPRNGSNTLENTNGVSKQSDASKPSYSKTFGDYLTSAKSNTDLELNGNKLNHNVLYNRESNGSNGYIRPTPTPYLSFVSKPERARLSIDTPPLVNNGNSNSSRYESTTPVQKEEKSKDDNDFLVKYTTGLVNLGNSCYMNSVLQCVAATPQLTRFFFPSSTSPDFSSYRQHININNKLGSKGILTNSFVKLLLDMFSNNRKSFSPSEFKRVVGSLSPGRQFANYDQQDCNEFLTFLLDSLHEDLNQMVITNPAEKKALAELTPDQEKEREKLPVRIASTIEWERYLKLNFSVIVGYFQGQYLSQLKCLECGETSTSYNAFSVLSLPIPEKYGNSQNILLDDCLKEFTTVELLDDDNRWRCPNCKRQTKSTKRIVITRLPDVLIIHFKRFKLTSRGYFNKLDTFIKYPVKDVLDLTSYWPPVGTSFSSSITMSKEKEQKHLSTLKIRNQTPPFRYKLYGVANHYGNLTTGHYTSYVHKVSDSKKTRNWCYFDDSKITYNCSESQVLNKNAYCLFYQRV